MMRGFLVYWQCPRHVMSLGGYPERISPWLVMLPLPCCVQPLLHSCVCGDTATSWRGPDTLPLTPLGCQLRSSGTLPWHLWWGTLAQPRRKQNKTAEPKCEVISLCWRPQRLQISLKSLLQKCVCCLSSLEAMDYSEFCKPHWDLQDATRLWDTRSLETGLRKSDLVNICLHPRKLQSCPQIWMGWSTLDFPCVSLHYSLSSQKVKMLHPPREGRQPNPSPDNTQYHTAVTKNKLV